MAEDVFVIDSNDAGRANNITHCELHHTILTKNS